ncbi:MAG: bifunctional folylpolyglutamate synthase/dihydrofolate synthase [Desulfobacterales bacterium]|nr:bifunctional folylpolyglutamate synthase/dihydrofolate synthase [Desulfobacterales bacterium]MCP4158561.1 bifunctional folylpolyglutamate synthase/dihydrofolate synthase [Deltaproteobacteria bacterium]
MFNLRRFGIKLGLDTIGSILNDLGNPQNKFATIHIAGTNGKGSIASALSEILIKAGYKTGLYTSPHLVKFNERIKVNNVDITDERVVALYEAVSSSGDSEREATFFEATTAMALYEFSNQNVDIAIIETGMGGRLDATNILNPAISVITNISVEHQAYLGDTIEEIAFEKGGIIKENTPVVVGTRQDSVNEVIKKIAKEKNATLYHMGLNFESIKQSTQIFKYNGINSNWEDFKTGLSGDHQIDNSALTLATCELLIEKGYKLNEEDIRFGLLNNKWPGRLEVVSEAPLIILDGAHNDNAAFELANFLKNDLKDRHITLVVGILDDKSYSSMLASLLEACDSVILTQPVIERSLPPESLKPFAEKYVNDIVMIKSVSEAVDYAIKNAKDAICIAGSLYVAGEAKIALMEMEI